MFPTSVMMDRIRTLLSQDTGSIAHGTNACHLILCTASFTPRVDLVIGDLTKAVTPGLTGLTLVTGNQNESVDPVTGEHLIEMKAPAGGFRFEATGGTGLPATIFGAALVDSTEAIVLASALLPNPVTINAVNQSLTIDQVEFAIDPAKIR